MCARRKTEQALTDIDFAIEAARVYGVYEGKSKEVRARVNSVLRKYRENRSYVFGPDLLENLRVISLDKEPPEPMDKTLEGTLISLLEYSSVISLSTECDDFVRAKCAEIIDALKEEGVDARYNERETADNNYSRLIGIEADRRIRELANVE